jgi:hypothetical protein
LYKIAVFFSSCEVIDCEFKPFLDKKMKGDSTSPEAPEVAVGKKRGGEDIVGNINQLVVQGNALIKHLKLNWKEKKV